MFSNLVTALRNALVPVGEFLSNVLGALAILVVGGIAAILIARAVQSGLVRLGGGGLIYRGLADS